jgi:hypothetical protein
MAIFRANRSLMDISGRRGGHIFFERRCSNQILPIPRPVTRPPTQSQRRRRAAFLRCIIYLEEEYTWELFEAWSTYGVEHPRKNRKGMLYAMSWTQAFMSVNITRVYNGLPILRFPPDYSPGAA